MLKASISGTVNTSLPQWGRCFWQDPNDGNLFLAYASGNQEVDFIWSSNSGITWSNPSLMFKVDDFNTYNNFDTFMDYEGHVHAGFRLNNSGCYQFFGKVGPNLGWTAASGRGTVQLNNASANDNGLARGWQGSISRLETSSAFGVYSTFPRVILACKNSNNGIDIFTQQRPFNGFMARDATNTSNGADYNFPIIATNAFGNGTWVLWQSGSNIQYREEFFSWSAIRDGTYLGIGTIPWGPNLAFGSGANYTSNLVISCASSGQELYGVVEDTNFTPAYKVLASGWIPNATGTIKNKFKTDYPGVFNPSGTICDFSFKDNLGQNILYFAGKNEVGTNCIQRVIGEHVRPKTIGQTTKWQFNSNHSVSGIKNVAPCNQRNSGGVFNVGFWRQFKACKHPVSAGVKRNPLVDKGEFLVTSAYAPSSPSGSIINIFEITSSEVGPATYPLPNYFKDYTEDSNIFPKSNITDVIVSSGGFTAPANFQNIFDRDGLSTVVTLGAAGGFLTLKFAENVAINKIEIGKQFSRNWGNMSISGSFDNINWSRLAFTDVLAASKSVLYFDARQNNSDSLNMAYMEAPIVKYLRFFWAGNGTNTCTINTMRIFGPGNTKLTETVVDSQLIPRFFTRPWRPKGSDSTERFVYFHDTRPPGFEYSGDFDWRVVASGEFTRTNYLPGAGSLGNGLVPSGTYAGSPNGDGDGFAMRSTPYPSIGSGVATTYIRVDEGNRTLSWRARYDMNPSDRFEVWSAGPSDGTMVQRVVATGIQNYTSNSITLVDVGEHVVKFVHFRGATTDSSRYGVVWLDNFIGLSVAQPTINAFLIGQAPGTSGTINVFINGKESSYVYGYLPAAALSFYVNAYLNSQAFINTSGSIDAYMFGKGTYINAYCAGGSDSTYLLPTGSIYGYIGVGSQVVQTSINAYLAESQLNSIYGFLMGHQSQYATAGSGNHIINGYLLAQKPVSSIYAALNANANTSNSNINNYLKASVGDQSILAYLHMNSGTFSSIGGFTEGWSFAQPPQNIIWAVMPDTTATNSGIIYSYMLSQFPYESILAYMGPGGSGGAIAGGPGGGGLSTTGVLPTNIINSYLKAHDGIQTIYGYLHKEPYSISNILGYMAGGVSQNEIYGYLKGKEQPSGIIYGLASGVGYGNQFSYAYLPSVSGIVNTRIYGYANGAIIIMDERDAIIIGMPSGNQECRSFGLMPENPGVIPNNTSPGLLL